MTLLIAEVKTQSPFGYKSDKSWEYLLQIACTNGDWVSIHTDSRWDGSWKKLKIARESTRKPILAKGYHSNDDEIRKALDLGANYVLVVNRIPDLKLLPYCLIEPQTIDDLIRLPQNTKAVWNDRDLNRHGTRKVETYALARKNWSGWLCQASFIRDKKDINPQASAILVGEGLESYLQSLK